MWQEVAIKLPSRQPKNGHIKQTISSTTQRAHLEKHDFTTKNQKSC